MMLPTNSRFFAVFCFFFIVSTAAYSQDSDAKVKYNEAEAAFVSNNYQLALDKLNECEKLLGSSNPRVLFLRIQIENAVFSENPVKIIPQIASFNHSCNTYLEKYKDQAGLFEKYQEVHKLKQKLQLFPVDSLTTKKVDAGDVVETLKTAKIFSLLNQPQGAFYMYNKLLDKNIPQAQHYIGTAYEDTDKGTTINRPLAIEYYKKAAAQNYALSYLALSRCYLWKEDFKPDEALSDSCYRQFVRLAEKSDVSEVMGQLGLEYIKGYKTLLPKNIQKGEQLINAAAEKGYPECLIALATIYADGCFKNRDPETCRKSVQLCVKAADLGLPSAWFALAEKYQSGSGVEKNETQAMACYQKAAELSCTKAFGRIGDYYYYGGTFTVTAVLSGTAESINNPSSNISKAITWYEKGVKMGDASSAASLSAIYYDGNGVTKSNDQGFKYLRQASNLDVGYDMSHKQRFAEILVHNKRYSEAINVYASMVMALDNNSYYGYREKYKKIIADLFRKSDGDIIPNESIAAWWENPVNSYPSGKYAVFATKLNDAGKAKDKKEKLESYTKLLTEYPGYPFAPIVYLNMADMKRALEDKSGACEDVRKAIELGSSKTWACQ